LLPLDAMLWFHHTVDHAVEDPPVVIRVEVKLGDRVLAVRELAEESPLLEEATAAYRRELQGQRHSLVVLPQRVLDGAAGRRGVQAAVDVLFPNTDWRAKAA